MRYLIIDSEIYPPNADGVGDRYRIIYDTQRAHFHTVQKHTPDPRPNDADRKIWKNAPLVADAEFYDYYPGHAKNIRGTDKLPNWK